VIGLLSEGLWKGGFDLGRRRERVVVILGPGALVGELAVIDGTPRCPVSRRRSSRSSAAPFSKSSGAPSEIFRIIAGMLARRRLRNSKGALVTTGFLWVKGRACDPRRYGGQGRISIRQRMTQSDLAALAALTGAREFKSKPRLPGLDKCGARERVCRLLLRRKQAGA
jgi:CRP-like cAMP-binding protein